MKSAGLLVILAGALIITSNLSRFVDAKPQIRASHFEFVPSPEVARILSCGQASTLANIRWIDSFAWFQWQIDHPHDVRTHEGRSLMALHYDTLISLDPLFEPFYYHSSLNLSGIMGRHGEGLGMLARGTFELPHSPGIWRNFMAELQVRFNFDQRQPQTFAAILGEWARNMDDDNREQVWIWRNAMARRSTLGTAEVGYWADRLQETKPGSPYEEFLLEAARQAAARIMIERLTPLVAALDSSQPIQDVTNPSVLRAVYPTGLPSLCPIILTSSGAQLAPDPWGYPFQRLGATNAVSPGFNLDYHQRRVLGLNSILAKADASVVDNLEQAIAISKSGPHPPFGRWVLSGRQLTLVREPAPFPAWDPRKQPESTRQSR